ncbi:guanylin [Bombina bombina]|uniref:guanylin n=1 Tax=Bombina bombina TaxID=8345 RepID=UPI00235B2C53|nr:guanylin [Bombina bombina]
MQTLGIKAFCVFILIHISSGVIVKDGDFTFSLDSVKALQKVLDQQVTKLEKVLPKHEHWSAEKLCALNLLPKEFAPVCDSANAQDVFDRLEKIAMEPDICEVCAMAACSGC